MTLVPRGGFNPDSRVDCSATVLEGIPCLSQIRDISLTHTGKSWTALFLNRHVAEMDEDDRGRIDVPS